VQQAEAAVASGEESLISNERQKELQEARIVQAAQGIEAAVADIAAANAGIEAAKSSIGNARSGVDAAKAEVERSASELGRQQICLRRNQQRGRSSSRCGRTHRSFAPNRRAARMT